ncbi:unnamed protein product, partial [Iphiclides podalirius]
MKAGVRTVWLPLTKQLKRKTTHVETSEMHLRFRIAHELRMWGCVQSSVVNNAGAVSDGSLAELEAVLLHEQFASPRSLRSPKRSSFSVCPSVSLFGSICV